MKRKSIAISALVVGHLSWTYPHPHGSQISFVVGRYPTESGESHLALIGLDADHPWHGDGNRGLIYRDHTASTWRYVSSLFQHHSSSSSARHHIEHEIDDFPSTSQPLRQPPMSQHPKDFLHLNAIMIVMEDCQRQIMCIIMYHAMPDGPCQSLCSNVKASEPESRAQ